MRGELWILNCGTARTDETSGTGGTSGKDWTSGRNGKAKKAERAGNVGAIVRQVRQVGRGENCEFWIGHKLQACASGEVQNANRPMADNKKTQYEQEVNDHKVHFTGKIETITCKK